MKASISPNQTQQTKHYVLAAITISVLLFFIVSIWFKPRRDLNENAIVGLKAVLEADGNCLTQLISAEERNQAGFTTNAIQQSLEKIILPFWRSKAKCGNVVKGSLTSQGEVGQGYELSNGVQVYLGVTTQSIEKRGPQLVCFSNLLRETWRAIYAEKNGPINTQDQQSRAMYEGIVRDRAYLEGLGVRGLIKVDPDKFGVSYRSFGETQRLLDEKFQRQANAAL